MQTETIKTTTSIALKPFLDHIYIPSPVSHKGQNGKLLVIGGSSLFHSASLWAAEIASHFVDIVHYSSTKENNEIVKALKEKFHNGIIISRENIPEYVKEDDAILVGPGMVRGDIKIPSPKEKLNFSDVLSISDEPTYTYQLVEYLITTHPKKRYVFDAGVLQMMKRETLLKLETAPILTPHEGEFEHLFGINLSSFGLDQKKEIVASTALKYHCVILMKAIVDIVSDGKRTYMVEGGNQGLSKGGTGDILAGLAASLFTKSDPFESAVVSSFALKKTADSLFQTKGYWYNIDDLICSIPSVFKQLLIDRI